MSEELRLSSLQALKDMVAVFENDDLSGYQESAILDARKVILAEETAERSPTFGDALALVIAAREFWDIHNDLSPESAALDKALEPFASTVPYENEPEELP